MVVATEQETRICTECGLDLPLSVFRRRCRDGDTRVHQCTPCHYAREKVRRREKRLKRVVTYAGNVARAKRNRNTIIRLSLQITRQFNGTEELARAMKAAYDQAVALGRPYTATRILRAIVELAIVGEREHADHVRDMTDEELHEADLRSAERLIQERPEIAILAADRCGWTIEPPEDTKPEDPERPLAANRA